MGRKLKPDFYNSHTLIPDATLVVSERPWAGILFQSLREPPPELHRMAACIPSEREQTTTTTTTDDDENHSTNTPATPNTTTRNKREDDDDEGREGLTLHPRSSVPLPPHPTIVETKHALLLLAVLGAGLGLGERSVTGPDYLGGWDGLGVGLRAWGSRSRARRRDPPGSWPSGS